MSTKSQTPLIHTTNKLCVPDFLIDWAGQFLIARKVEGVSPFTLRFYKQQLNHFLKFCNARVITVIQEITPNDIREFLLWMESTNHNPGGIHAAFRTLRAFLLWWEREVEPEGWKNPIHKIKAPKVGLEPLEPIELETVKTLIENCNRHNFIDDRDKAIFLTLLDSGLRAREFISIDLSDYNQMTGEILIRLGKGRKPRYVYLSRTTRKAIRQYLKHRTDSNPALWITIEGERFSYMGLRGILLRRSELVDIKPPTLHSFRRAFALNCLTNGMDIYTLQKLMGHADLTVLRRYLKQTEGNLQASHEKYSPVEMLK